MQIHRDTGAIPRIKKPVVTIGTFDGVHSGHKKILERIKQRAQKAGGASVLITFSPHPRQVLGKDAEKLRLLSTLKEKIKLLEQEALDHLVIATFTRGFAQQDPEAFVRDFLVNKLHPHRIVIGYDHRFGRDRSGDINFLRSAAPRYGFEVEEIERQLVDDIAVSSTKIRKALFEGDVAQAKRLLGAPYLFIGKVVEGRQRGHTLGFPTANLQPSGAHKLVPAKGVYAVTATHKAKTYKAMANIGQRPTFGGKHQTVEVHLFDFNRDIYGETLEVRFVKRIRNEARFDSPEALKQQLEADKKQAQRLLK